MKLMVSASVIAATNVLLNIENRAIITNVRKVGYKNCIGFDLIF